MKEEIQDETKFDLVVDHRDKKTGARVRSNPYILRVVNGAKMWERPVGSGNLWNSKNQPIGRWVNGIHDKAAAHVEFIAPLTEDQKLARNVVATEARNQELMKEIAALKAEAKKKDKGA